MQNVTTITSDTTGLWFRMIFQILGYWVGGIWFTIVILGLVSTPYFLFLFLGAAAIVIYYTITLAKDNPLGWKKIVTFNFDNKTITIISDYQRQDQQDVLDESARIIEFSVIEQLQAKTYDSFLSSSYYQISLILTSGQKIKLLALKSPNTYTELLVKFQKEGITLA